MIALVWSAAALSAQPFYPLYPTRHVKPLDGTWSFSFDPAFGNVQRQLDVTTIKTTESAVVPSAFDVAEPGVAGRRGTAFYRRSFSLPAGRPGRLHFAACSFYCRVWVDGNEIGHGHLAGGYTPFWLDVPAASSTADRELFVLVDNRFNNQTAPVHTGGDFYMYGGITRNVLLHTLPAAPQPHITFVGVLPLNTTHVNVSVALRGGDAAERVRVDLAFDGSTQVTAHLLAPAGGGTLATAPSIAVPNAMAWHPTSPHLHTVSASLRVAGNTTSGGDVAVARFGLRTVGVSSAGRLTLNGKQLKLKGINRHTMSAASGSALTLNEVQRDVELLKELGVNYVRGAHYPQDQRFLDLCDESGILVWEEALGPNVKTRDTLDPHFLAAQHAQVLAMVRASYSHPSIILHGFFNEGPSADPRACAGYNASAAAIRSLVPPTHRLVTWASSTKEHDVCLGAADVLSFNEYPGWYTESFSEVHSTWANFSSWAEQHYPGKPFLISETGGGAIYEWRNNATTQEVVGGYAIGKGALARGSDLANRSCTVEEAALQCNATRACAGFTFEAADAQPRGPVHVFFKAKETMPNGDDEWASWVKGGTPHPPKWSQGYQGQLVAADVRAAMSIEHVSGISLWQFNDIKADDGATKYCGSCEYSTPYNASVPMDCAYITAKCWRPGGENHKGLVDVWRRPKRAFGVVQALYKQA